MKICRGGETTPLPSKWNVEGPERKKSGRSRIEPF